MTRVHVAAGDEAMTAALEAATQRGGGVIVSADAAPEVLVAAIAPDHLTNLLRALPSIRWVQLGGAGIDAYAELLDPSLIWTSAKGAYAAPVAEHALTLALTSLRGIVGRARAGAWGAQAGQSLHGLRCAVVGGGGIGTEIVRLLQVFDVDITVVRRNPLPIDGANRVVAFEQLDSVLPQADVLFLAAALTPETDGMIDGDRLQLLPAGAVVVNIARGRLVDTDALVGALNSGQVAAAGLDVTEPEPLPEGHPLWSLENVLVTPHTADTQDMIRVMLGARVEENVRRWSLGQPLEGVVEPGLGY